MRSARWEAPSLGSRATPWATSRSRSASARTISSLATLGLEIPAGGAAPLTISLELSKVNEPVTIDAPPADEVKDAPG